MSAQASSTLDTMAPRRDVTAAQWPIVSADASDHIGIFCFLNSVFRGPSRGEFRTSLEDPLYQPADRLLAKEGERVVGHVQVLHRTMQLETLRAPVAQLDWLGTAPGRRGRGLGTQLVRTAESRMIKSGALAGWVRTPSPRFFRRLGWTVCGRHSQSCGDARRVLSVLIDKGLPTARRRAKLHIRPWLLWELGALTRLYQESIRGLVGSYERTEAYWRWLVERHGFDELYVAIDGPELIDMDEQKAPVVGYAAIKGEQILELAASPEKPAVAMALLARACRDAIEAGRQGVLLHAPPDAPLHGVFREAGGQYRCPVADDGDVFMTRVFQPPALLRRMHDVLLRRAAVAGLPPALKLGFLVGKRRFLLDFAQGRLHVAKRKPARNTVELSADDFTRMLLGQLDWEQALAEQSVLPHTARAERFAQALFPAADFWRSPLDDVTRDQENPY